ncbi:MAG: metal-dependent hydrolase [Myxococcota bacterium]
MENLAHALCGWRIAELGWDRRIGPRAIWIGVIAANLPDADLLVAAWDRTAYLWWHRGLTHSFFGWPLLALAGAAATRRVVGQGTWRDHLGLWAAGLLSHALLDWPTTWGTMLFLPATDHRFGLDWIFIVDPIFWVLLGVVPRFLREATARARVALLSLAGWILLCGMTRELAGSHVRGPVEVFPSPLAPLFWTGVTREGEVLHRWWLTPWGAEEAGTFEVPAGPAVDALKEARNGERYFWMARAPALRGVEETPAGTVLTLSDLAFTSRFEPGSFRFTTRFTLAADGTVRMER